MMNFTHFTGARTAVAVAALAAALAVASLARAQVFGPPSTFFGTIVDSAGEIPENTIVEAYIGTTKCNTKDGKVLYATDGKTRIATYIIDVVSDEQKAGCGKRDSTVRIKIGDRLATQTGTWAAGPVELGIAFGSASPVPQPTAAPTATPNVAAIATSTSAARATSIANGTPAAALPGGGSVATIPPGSPGAGSPVPTTAGGLVTSGPGPTRQDAGGDGGFPVWGVVVIGLLVLAGIGGGAGVLLARSRGTH